MIAAADPGVPREALAEHASAKRRYVSGARTASKRSARQRLIDAALAAMANGDFRPSTRDLTRAAGCHHGAVSFHFGALHLMMRVLAREHWEAVAALLPFVPDDPKEVVWLVLVGTPRPS